MKAFALVSLLFAVGTNAHAIFQKLRVNGAEQGQLVGVRAPSTNNPITDVSSSSITCNTGLISPVSTAVVDIPAGAKVGAWWQHIIGGPQGTNDADNPIAKSHKGPVQVYLAKVDNAGTSGTTGLKWFKIHSYGLQGGVWGVDDMINNNGWADFTIPSCIAPGNYLMRVEIIALHNAYTAGGAQFYMSCANINITGSGTYSPSSTVSLPGVYSSSDPGITINIYDSSGQPTNGGKAYTAPGPAVISCSDAPPASSSTNQVSTTSTTRTSSSSTSSTRTSTASGSGQTLYGQCGGQGWTGPTTCASGTCTVSNQYYSQCLP